SGEGRWETSQVQSIYALSPTNVWIGAGGGNLWQYDGGTWIRHSGVGGWGTETVLRVYALSSDNIWISGNSGNVWQGTSESSGGSPIISEVEVESSNTSTTITWETDVDSSSQVRYGLTNSVGSETDEEDIDTRVQEHSVTIEDLVSCTTYYYQVVSKDS